MHRVLVAGSLVVAVGVMGVTRFTGIEERLGELDRLRRDVPASARAMHQELAELEGELTALREDLALARSAGERARQARQDAERRLEALSAEVAQARAALDQQAEVVRALEGQAAHLEELETGALARWNGLSEAVNATAHLAERTSNELGELHAGLEGPSEEVRWCRMVAPTVQLAGDTTVGSGVLLESRPEVGRPGEFETLLLTSWHVVRDIRADALQSEPPIPVAIHLDTGEIRHETATLLAHDADIDVALLRLDTAESVPFGASLPRREELAALRVFRPVVAVGCPLGNDPVPTHGELSDLDHHVDGDTYWMISAPTYIGNSGGGIFDGPSQTLIGIFSKIYTHGSLRPTVVPHMGLVTPMPQIYDWLETNGYAELVPGERGLTLSLAQALRR